MQNLYKYTGSISGFSFNLSGPKGFPVVDMILSETFNNEKPPVRLEAHGGLAEYIEAIEKTDAEERYFASDWYYDSLLWLHRIEIPSTDPDTPAKIITQLGPLDRELAIFGPAEYIKISEPGPMDREQLFLWYDFHRCSMNRTGWR